MNKELLKNPFAHRGLFDNEYITENSIPAFESALNKNHSIELDIRITSDNKLVVFHDHNLERLTGIKKEINEIESSDLKNIKLKNSEQSIPAIDEVLELVNGRVAILIDIKNGRTFGILENELLKSLKNYKGYFAVHSSSPFSRNWIKRKSPEIEVGQLVSNFNNLNFLVKQGFMQLNKFSHNLVKPDFLSCNIDSLPDKWAERIRKNGIPVLSWTIKNTEQYEKAKKYSDNFIWEKILLD